MEELEKEPYADIPVATPAPEEEEDEEELPVRISSPAALDTTRVTSPSPSVVAQNTAQGSRAPSASASRTSASASTRTSASGGGGGYFSFGNFFGPAADSAAGDAGGGLSGEKGAPAAAVAADATTEASQSASGTSTKDGVAAEVAPEGPVRTVRDIKSMIKDVVLLGAPLNLKVLYIFSITFFLFPSHYCPHFLMSLFFVPLCSYFIFLQSKSWAKIREVVAGRLINGYSTCDMVLSVVYR